MSTACDAPPRLFEERALMPGRVDKSARVIRGVKILGLQSRNTARVLGCDEHEFGCAVDEPYSYSERALREAAKLYDNAQVVVDHPQFSYKSSGARTAITDHSARDVVGSARHISFRPGDGLFGDLHLLVSHEFTPTLLEVAANDPRLLSLSHEVDFARPRLVGGKIVIDRITAVHCVAVVPTGATTVGLFESAARCKGSLVAAFRRPPTTRSAPEQAAPPKPSLPPVDLTKKGSLVAAFRQPASRLSPTGETS
jgi:hypothetical protein